MGDPVIRAVALAMAAGDHFALGGKGGAPDLIRELDRLGYTIRRKRRLSMRMRPVVGFVIDFEAASRG